MSNLATQANDNGKLMHDVIVKGSLAQLSESDRTMYYVEVCNSVGLNPLTKPFEYLTLNHKMVLYAKRDATDQLRQIHGVSVEELTETEREGVFIVTAKVRNKEGRTDVAKGAVNINGLSGENLANALMKAETKAKRRATLSICGLGILDETEIETIQQTAIRPMQQKMDVISDTQREELFAIINKKSASIDKILEYYGVESLADMAVSQYEHAKEKLSARPDKEDA